MQPQFSTSTATFSRTSSRFDRGMIAKFIGITVQSFQGTEYPALTFEGGLTITLNDLKRVYAHTPLNGTEGSHKRQGTFVDAFWDFFDKNKNAQGQLPFAKFDDFSKLHEGKEIQFNLDFEYKNDRGIVRDFLRYDFKAQQNNKRAILIWLFYFLSKHTYRAVENSLLLSRRKQSRVYRRLHCLDG